MYVKEKLMELLRKPIFRHELADPVEAAADYLIANGVTIQSAPTITYADLVPHGRWETECEPHYTCSACKHWFNLYGPTNFCPNCGAKMDL